MFGEAGDDGVPPLPILQTYSLSDLFRTQQSLQENNADPFIILAFQNALRNTQGLKYSALHLDFKFITEPLEQVLFAAKSVNYILLQLQALEVRFHRHYTNTDVDWGSNMDTNTEFLKLVWQMDPASLAISLSKSNRHLFQQLDERSLKNPDSDLMKKLFGDWDHLARSVEECMAAGVKVRQRIEEIAKVCRT